MTNEYTSHFIDDAHIVETLKQAESRDAAHVREVLSKSRELKGLDLSDIAVLMKISDPDLLHELFTTAKSVKEEIYGRRLVIFAPLYICQMALYFRRS